MKMKKLITLLYTSVTLLCSCDMDVLPYDKLSEEDAILNVDDCESFRNGLYASMRGLTTGGFITFSEIQMDDFHAVIGNGNRGGEFYRGEMLTSTGDIESVWGGYYGMIASANYINDRVTDLLKSTRDKDAVFMQRYQGEALFMRAYSYYHLATLFCPAYTSATKERAASGMPLQLTYKPSSDNNTYPGRATLGETFDQIRKDLNEALLNIEQFESYISNDESTEESFLKENLPAYQAFYVTSDAVKAMQARVALYMGDNAEAYAKAKELIDSKRYALTSSKSSYKKMWTNDLATEIIWRLQMDQTYNGSSTGSTFLSTSGNPDYVPTMGTVALFQNGANDYRYNAFLDPNTPVRVTGSSVVTFSFTKYPGNTALYTGSNNFKNMSKPFRLAELYLIAAEANAQTDPETANQYLNDLCKTRIAGYQSVNLSGSSLVEAIRNERHRELMCEGFRLSDLKRWGIGFERAEPNEETIVNTSDKVYRLKYEANDYRFVWPIPKSEMDSNPQLQGQQNPGY